MSPGTKALLKGFPATLSNIFGFLWQHLPLVPAHYATAIAVILPPWSPSKQSSMYRFLDPCQHPRDPQQGLWNQETFSQKGGGVCTSVLFSKQVLNIFRRSFTFTPVLS